MRAGEQAARNKTSPQLRPNQAKESIERQRDEDSVGRARARGSRRDQNETKQQAREDARENLRERYVEYHALQRQPNVKHQRARAEVSRAKDELSLRALRCMR